MPCLSFPHQMLMHLKYKNVYLYSKVLICAVFLGINVLLWRTFSGLKILWRTKTYKKYEV